jgi:PIN like domain
VTGPDQAERFRGLYEGFEGYRTPTDQHYQDVLTAGLVVPDANVLLNLYRYNAQTQADLFAVLDRLGDRLWVPHQVVVEFWKNRESALRDPRDTGEEAVDRLAQQRQQSVTVLRTWANRIALPPERLSELQDAIEHGFATVSEAILGLTSTDAADRARNTNNDPVLSTLESVLRDRVGRPLGAEAHAEALEEGRRRIREGLPPGYQDKGKGDDLAVGDYLVWAQLLEEAARRRGDVLLITGDVKEDWWRRERGQTRGPRLELVDELHSRCGGRLFMLRPESLLQHAKEVLNVAVSDASVQDVERVDRSLSVDESGGWTLEGVQELLDRLSEEGQPQADIIRFAAENDGFVSREKVYELAGFDENRMLRGFTRPPNRIAQQLRDHGVIPNGALDVLTAVYDPAFSYVQACGFEIPDELIPLVKAAT